MLFLPEQNCNIGSVLDTLVHPLCKHLFSDNEMVEGSVPEADVHVVCAAQLQPTENKLVVRLFVVI
jgi:hypothetical protein